jgi:hypothetical protein
MDKQRTGKSQPKDTNKNDKNDKKETPDFFYLKKRYAHQNLVDQVFKAIASTRKSGKVSKSVLLAQLQKWAEYPAEQVESGIKVYLGKNCAANGWDEKYLFGIIRSIKNQIPEKKPNSNKPKYLTKDEIYGD